MNDDPRLSAGDGAAARLPKWDARVLRGLAWNDPDLAIDWPVLETDALVLDCDIDRPRFSDVDEFFPYHAESGGF